MPVFGAPPQVGTKSPLQTIQSMLGGSNLLDAISRILLQYKPQYRDQVFQYKDRDGDIGNSGAMPGYLGGGGYGADQSSMGRSNAPDNAPDPVDPGGLTDVSGPDRSNAGPSLWQVRRGSAPQPQAVRREILRNVRQSLIPPEAQYVPERYIRDGF